MAKRRLNRQQIERIRHIHDRRRQRAAERAARQAEHLSDQLGAEQQGLVVANFGPHAIIEDSAGQPFRCVARQNLPTLVCGDRVIWQTCSVQEGVVIAVQPRQSLLQRPAYDGQLRPIAANLNQAIIVIAPKPDFIESLLDRYLVVMAALDIEAIILINKIDLLSHEQQRQAFMARVKTYQDIGYSVLAISNRTGQGIAALHQKLEQGTSILLGQSGVGKSSLIKSLLPDRKIRIRALSEATGLGTHTTTTSMLYHLPQGGDLIDSPGVRSFEPGTVTLAELERGFIEFRPYLGQCKFSNCGHDTEPGCALREAVAQGDIATRRLQSFLQLRNRLET